MMGTQYDFGVTVAYREGTVAGIFLEEESKSVYKTTRGISIGASKDEIKRAYGKKYALEAAENNLDYIYNSKSNEFLGMVSAQSLDSKDVMAETFMLSVMLKDGVVDRIMLLVRQMAFYFN